MFNASFETLLTFLPDLHTHEERRQFITEVVPRDHELWVAEEEGRVVAFAAIGESTLGHIYVHPDFHGRGLGTALLDKVKSCGRGLHALDVPGERGRLPVLRAHGLRAIEYGDGSGNEEGVPDVRYEWLPA